ncbi:protein ROOT HAIR DEFECTIVE 3-like [Rutidosis leptorrhynchoides]|uniref:protein ROOT HAIR DEFECTIVE 3-like n=1 Tax=Rutidosis leptorrhynchoides TaxID=125765 RepID=UPI003A996B85
MDQNVAKLQTALNGPVDAVIDGAASDTWPAIRKLVQKETKTNVSEVSGALSGFEIDEDARKNLLSGLENYAIDLVESKAKECLKLLSVVAAIRLEDYGDRVEGILLGALAEPSKGPNTSSNLQLFGYKPLG